jgi:homoserine O-acetyltransferase
MVESQYQLLQHLGITHLVAVAGASMGGVQTLECGVSHPVMMDHLIALTPMARSSAWSIAVNQATRNALMLDPKFDNGHYTVQPDKGWSLTADILQVPATPTPAAIRQQFAQPAEVLGWMTAQEDAVVKSGFEANDWIVQTWAYDHHNVGDTDPAFHGDPTAALRIVKAHTLVMSGLLDRYNPVEEGIDAASAIPGGVHVSIPSVQGHVAASAGFQAQDLAFINMTVLHFVADGR